MDSPLGIDNRSLRIDEARLALRRGTGNGVRIAVVDSGIERDHPALTELKLIDDWHIVDSGVQIEVKPGDGSDIFGHGTAIASVIHRIVPEAEIESFRVLGETLSSRTAIIPLPGSQATLLATKEFMFSFKALQFVSAGGFAFD